MIVKVRLIILRIRSRLPYPIASFFYLKSDYYSQIAELQILVLKKNLILQVSIFVCIVSFRIFSRSIV